MVFSSLIFICVFLPITLLIYYLVPSRVKNYFLMLASLFFYAWGGTTYVFLLIALSFVDYLLGMMIYKYTRFGKLFLILGVGVSILTLGYYKYAGFILFNLSGLLNLDIKTPEILLPIGISFYTFQGLSYLIDVYRFYHHEHDCEDTLKGCEVQKNPFKLLLYISLFPQLIAGPIVRYKDISSQIADRKHSIEKFSRGMERFIYGLAKKVIIADTMGIIADKIFGLGDGNLATYVAWIGAICYTLQIYYDFAGYSDMAIGLAGLFGFDFLENFNYPYISKSITEFWRRWHISLSSWFRDYVYIPLGGNRTGNVYRNLFIVFLLTGIWHGAEWTFVLWGIWYGIFIVLERLVKNSKFHMEGIPGIVKWAYTMLIVILGWVLFRADSIWDATTYLKCMFGMGQLEFSPFHPGYYLDHKAIFVMAAAVLLAVLPVDKWISAARQKAAGEILIKIFSAVLLVLCFLVIVNNSYSPFIYFRF